MLKRFVQSQGSLFRLSIRPKLIIFFSLMFALLSVFNYTYYPKAFKEQSMTNLKNLVYNMGEMLALTAGISFELSDFESIQTTIEWAKRDKRLSYFGIFDPNGTEVAVFNPAQLKLNADEMLKQKGIRETNGGVFVAAPINYHDHNHGALILGLSLSELNAAIAENKTTSLYISLMIFILGLIVVIILSNMILNPIVDLAQAANEVSKGNTEVEIRVSTRDEIGDLGNCFNNMVQNIKKSIVGQVAAIAKTAEVLSRLSNEINDAVSGQVVITNQQTSTVTEITATMQELSISSSEVAENCTMVTNTAMEGLNQSEHGMEAIDSLKSKMMEITEANNASAGKIINLGNKSSEIGKIMQIINDIADQTKLIAFNAALEASSAGEAGKRFGVVASEVRRLASNITSSTGEIEKKIEEIQQLSHQLVIASEAESQRIEEGSVLANKTFLKLEQLVQGSTSTHSVVSLISTSTQQQKTATEQVAVALREIEKGSHQSSDAVKQISVAITELTSLASELSLLVSDLQSQKEREDTGVWDRPGLKGHAGRAIKIVKNALKGLRTS